MTDKRQYVAHLPYGRVFIMCPRCLYAEIHDGPEDVNFLLARVDDRWNYENPWYYCGVCPETAA